MLSIIWLQTNGFSIPHFFHSTHSPGARIFCFLPISKLNRFFFHSPSQILHLSISPTSFNLISVILPAVIWFPPYLPSQKTIAFFFPCHSPARCYLHRSFFPLLYQLKRINCLFSSSPFCCHLFFRLTKFSLL